MTGSEPRCEGLVPFDCNNPECPVHGVLTGQVNPLGTFTLPETDLPLADEPVKFPWEDPLPGGQGADDG